MLINTGKTFGSHHTDLVQALPNYLVIYFQVLMKQWLKYVLFDKYCFSKQNNLTL